MVYSILIGGKAGLGIKKAAQVIATTLLHDGWHVFQQDDYQSLIKGGHNFSIVSFGTEPVNTGYSRVNLIISLDKRSATEHENDLLDDSPGCYHIYNADDAPDGFADKDGRHISIPLDSLLKQLSSSGSVVSMAAIAIAFSWLGWDADKMQNTIKKEYKRDREENIQYAIHVFSIAVTHNINSGLARLANHPKPKSRLLSGNQAIALGAWAAGLDFYYAYPMTPASSILHYLALKQSTHHIYAIHAESELAAANMAIGSIVAGAKTAVGSSGGGFALMQEAFSLAGMVEAPLLCILASRPGPATGVSTYTAQEDLAFALHQGHGEFGRVVAAPDSIERAYSLSAELLCLAWEYQSPVILLSDKHLSESSIDFEQFSSVPFADDYTIMANDNNDYTRYSDTEDGVSPLLFPGSDNVDDDTVIKWNSHEHVAQGLRTDKARDMIIQKDKRNRKSHNLHLATKRYKRVNIYGDRGTPVFAYGSSVMELLEARKYCRKDFRIVSLVYLLPFPQDELNSFASNKALVLEHNSTGSFATYLQQHLSLEIVNRILRYDGRPFDPKELAALLEEYLDA